MTAACTAMPSYVPTTVPFYRRSGFDNSLLRSPLRHLDWTVIFYISRLVLTGIIQNIASSDFLGYGFGWLFLELVEVLHFILHMCFLFVNMFIFYMVFILLHYLSSYLSNSLFVRGITEMPNRTILYRCGRVLTPRLIFKFARLSFVPKICSLQYCSFPPLPVVLERRTVNQIDSQW